jgi:hypothetical protein
MPSDIKNLGKLLGKVEEITQIEYRLAMEDF